MEGFFFFCSFLFSITVGSSLRSKWMCSQKQQKLKRDGNRRWFFSTCLSLLVSPELHMRLEVRRMLFVSLSQGAIHHTFSDAGDRFQAESSGSETKQRKSLSKHHTNEPLSFLPIFSCWPPWVSADSQHTALLKSGCWLVRRSWFSSFYNSNRDVTSVQIKRINGLNRCGVRGRKDFGTCC